MYKSKPSKKPEKKKPLLPILRTLDYGCVFSLCVLGLTVGMVYYATYLEIASNTLWHVQGLFDNATAANSTVMPEETPKRLHPLFMGLFFGMQTLGILLYRICCCYCRTTVSILHTILTFSGVVLGCAGLTYDHPALLPENHFKSFHSRMGLLAIVMTTLQAVVGTVLYIVLKTVNPLTSAVWRTLYTPYHNIAGVCIFLCIALCCVTGLEISIRYSYPVNSTAYYLTLNTRSEALYKSHMAHLEYVRLLFIVVTILIFYGLIKEDFRSRGRIMMARDEEYR